MPFPRTPLTDETARGEPDGEMFEAVRRNDYLEVIRLVERGSSPQATDPAFGMPVAFWAAEFGHATSLQVLICLGADKDCVGFDGDRPLHVAARKGDLACTAVLLITRADTEALNLKLERPLHTSSSFGNLAVSYLLLIGGADRTAKDGKGRTPAERAGELGYTLLEFTFAWLSESSPGGECCAALRCSLAFRMVRRWLAKFGMSGIPSEDGRQLHILTKLQEPCEAGQHPTAPVGDFTPRGLITEAVADVVM